MTRNVTCQMQGNVYDASMCSGTAPAASQVLIDAKRDDVSW